MRDAMLQLERRAHWDKEEIDCMVKIKNRKPFLQRVDEGLFKLQNAMENPEAPESCAAFRGERLSGKEMRVE